VLGLAEVFVRLRAFFKLELVDEVPLGRVVDVDAGGIGLMEGDFCVLGYGEYGTSLGEQFTLINLGARGHFGTLSH
jgi:hypothetical protein